MVDWEAYCLGSIGSVLWVLKILFDLGLALRSSSVRPLRGRGLGFPVDCIEVGEIFFLEASPVLVERDELRDLICVLFNGPSELEFVDGDLEPEILGRGRAWSGV